MSSTEAELKYTEFTPEMEHSQLETRLLAAESEHFRIQMDIIERKARGEETTDLDQQLVDQRKVVEAFQTRMTKVSPSVKPSEQSV